MPGLRGPNNGLEVSLLRREILMSKTIIGLKVQFETKIEQLLDENMTNLGIKLS